MHIPHSAVSSLLLSRLAGWTRSARPSNLTLPSPASFPLPAPCNLPHALVATRQAPGNESGRILSCSLHRPSPPVPPLCHVPFASILRLGDCRTRTTLLRHESPLSASLFSSAFSALFVAPPRRVSGSLCASFSSPGSRLLSLFFSVLLVGAQNNCYSSPRGQQMAESLRDAKSVLQFCMREKLTKRLREKKGALG